jgi:hypothetical protein
MAVTASSSTLDDDMDIDAPMFHLPSIGAEVPIDAMDLDHEWPPHHPDGHLLDARLHDFMPRLVSRIEDEDEEAVVTYNTDRDQEDLLEGDTILPMLIGDQEGCCPDLVDRLRGLS